MESVVRYTQAKLLQVCGKALIGQAFRTSSLSGHPPFLIISLLAGMNMGELMKLFSLLFTMPTLMLSWDQQDGVKNNRGLRKLGQIE